MPLSKRKGPKCVRVERASNWFPVGVEASTPVRQALERKGHRKHTSVTEAIFSKYVFKTYFK